MLVFGTTPVKPHCLIAIQHANIYFHHTPEHQPRPGGLFRLFPFSKDTSYPQFLPSHPLQLPGPLSSTQPLSVMNESLMLYLYI